MIIYIHGFGSSGKGKKAQLFKEHYKNEEFYAPSLPYIPELAICNLEEMIENNIQRDKIVLIGSSLGGFYAMYLSQKYKLKAVLINPAADPISLSETLEGEQKSWFDESTFKWQTTHTAYLDKMKSEMNTDFSHTLSFIKTGDEILDYRVSQSVLKNSYLEIIDGGDHSFLDIINHFKQIDSFIQN